MTTTLPAKTPPSSIGFLRPILLISVALHGLLLFIPTGGDKKDTSLDVKDEDIKVTQLPAAPRNPIAVTPSTPNKPTVKLPTLPPKVGSLNSVLPKSGAKSTSSVTTQGSKPASTTPASTTTVSTTTTIPQGGTTPLPATPQTLPSLPSSSTTASSSSTTSTQPSSPKFAAGVAARNPNPKIVLEFNETLKQLRSDFPNYPGARLGCAGLPSCYIAKADMAKINDFVTQGLQAKGFELTAESDEPNRKVYRVSRDGKDHSLTILTDGLFTVYLLADAPRAFTDIQTAQQHFASYTSVLDRLTAINTTAEQSIDSLAATPTDFIKPELFYKSITSDTTSAENMAASEVNTSTDGKVRLIRNQTPDQVLPILAQELQTAGFQVETTKAQYGGGSLHQVTKDNIRLFLNLVPTKDGQGTILVTWYASPAKGMAFRNQNYFVISDRL